MTTLSATKPPVSTVSARSGDDQTRLDAHTAAVVAKSLSASQSPIPTTAARSGDDQHLNDAQPAFVVAKSSGAKNPPLTTAHPRQNGVGDDHHRSALHDSAVVADPHIPLRLAADSLNDIERLRIATENRIRALSEIPRWALTPAALRWQTHLASLNDLEAQVTKELQRAVRDHPLGPWIKRTVGIGEKQAGRLLGVLGDPAWNSAEDRPRRGPAELWAYCGYHTLPWNHGGHGTQSAFVPGSSSAGDQRAPEAHAAIVPGTPSVGGQTGDDHHHAVASDRNVAAKRQRGQRANWNADAKMRAFLIAESCVKQSTSPYRKVYDDARLKYADAVHPTACSRCGPAGKPASAGSPLSAGHQHARALRLVAKAVLRDLWIEATRLRKETP